MTTPTTSASSGTAVPDGAGRHASDEPATGAADSRWWLLLVLGVLTVFYGLLVMSLRPAALATVAVLTGIALLVAGSAHFLFARALDGPWRWAAYAGGVLAIAGAVISFVWPVVTLVVLAVLTAWAFVVNGLTRLVSTLAGPKRGLWWLGLVLGAAELLLGLWAVAAPGGELLLLVNLIGIFLVVAGIDAVFMAFAARTGSATAQ